MTATDELRRLLDECGVEWSEPNTMFRDSQTIWDAGAVTWIAIECRSPRLRVESSTNHLTPEQAIAATLGSGTCKWKPADFITEGDWWNTECGESFTWEPYGVPNYCPNCGAKVVEQ